MNEADRIVACSLKGSRPQRGSWARDYDAGHRVKIVVETRSRSFENSMHFVILPAQGEQPLRISRGTKRGRSKLLTMRNRRQCRCLIPEIVSSVRCVGRILSREFPQYEHDQKNEFRAIASKSLKTYPRLFVLDYVRSNEHGWWSFLGVYSSPHLHNLANFVTERSEGDSSEFQIREERWEGFDHPNESVVTSSYGRHAHSQLT